MCKVSVIVPIYNTAKYLKRCICSIVEQELKDIEIICVNDGSTDNSLEILQELASKDSRIKIINQCNGGSVSARKSGVVIAKGEYIGFVDSDDWVEQHMYKKLYNAAVKNDADVVSSSYWQEGAYSNISRDAVEVGVYDESRMDYLRSHVILYMEKHDKGLSGSLCTKVFRTDLLKRIITKIPDKIRISEDKITVLTFLLYSNKAVILDEAFYHYRINPTSMFHAEDSEYLLNYHLVYKYFKSLYSHKNFTEDMRIQAELYIVQFLIKGINTQMGFSFRNLMWIDPAWLEESSLGTRIALCGRGDLGHTYERQIRSNQDKKFVGYIDVDTNAQNLTMKYEFDAVKENFDSIVITTKNEEIANKIKGILLRNDIPTNKIFWFKQEEIFWKYAQAMGLIKRE